MNTLNMAGKRKPDGQAANLMSATARWGFPLGRICGVLHGLKFVKFCAALGANVTVGWHVAECNRPPPRAQPRKANGLPRKGQAVVLRKNNYFVAGAFVSGGRIVVVPSE